MVLEMMMSVRDAIKNPWHMIIFGFVISLAAMGISYFVFPENAGLMTVFMITIISSPFMLNLLKYEEWCEEKDFICKMNFLDKVNPIKAFFRSAMVFGIYSAFFGGVVLALTISYMYLPDSIAEKTFNDQMMQIQKISNLVSGNAVAGGFFEQIFVNNMIVLSISFVFALLFGLGAIFILAWNSSVLAVAIAYVTKGSNLTTALVQFLPHGVFEIAAYFLAAIAGGVLSVALTKKHTSHFIPVVRDMVLMMALGVVFIYIGAIIEIS